MRPIRFSRERRCPSAPIAASDRECPRSPVAMAREFLSDPLPIDLTFRCVREKASKGTLRKIAPKRFNPTGEVWLPVLHTRRRDWHFTVVNRASQIRVRGSSQSKASELARRHYPSQPRIGPNLTKKVDNNIVAIDFGLVAKEGRDMILSSGE